MLALIGKKVGMTQVFDSVGNLVPVTVIAFDANTVVSQRTEDKNGYEAVLVGSVDLKAKHTTKPYAGQFPEGVTPKKYLVEIKNFAKETEVGEELSLELFANSSYVDVIGTSKGKGFQGVMKRHGFGGGRATHGSKFHRANGSTGMAATPSKVHKGVKMAGRMGGERVTVQNLKIVKIDMEKNCLLVKGAVPGAAKSMVVVTTAKKKN